MPVEVQVKVLSAVGLPVMDRSSELTDAFVEVKFCSTEYKTAVSWKTLEPNFNSGWFTFRGSAEAVSSERLHLKVMDHDQYTTHDFIGKVCISLKPLMDSNQKSMSGWFPLYDTMNGNRGFLRIEVRLKTLAESLKQKFDQYNLPLFTLDSTPQGFELVEIKGLLNATIVEYDTEDNWIDFIRSSRQSNEIRLNLFRSLSARLQNAIKINAISASGNSVLGFKLSYNFEGENGVIARAIGTCATIKPIRKKPLNIRKENKEKSSWKRISFVASPDVLYFLDPDNLKAEGPLKSTVMECNVEKNSYHKIPICTLKEFPENFAKHVGGCITAIVVKIAHKCNSDEVIKRNNIWWNELRSELKRQAHSLNCNTIGGYKEVTTSYGKYTIMCAYGTAFNCSEDYSVLDESCCEFCHIPFKNNNIPYQISVFQCCNCRSHMVPEIMMTNLEKPKNLNVSGESIIVQTGYRRDLVESDDFVSYSSQELTFAIYELYSKLIKKMKIMGVNALFNINLDICLYEKDIYLSAMSTAYIVDALPLPFSLTLNNVILPDKVENENDKLHILSRIEEYKTKVYHHIGFNLETRKDEKHKCEDYNQSSINISLEDEDLKQEFQHTIGSIPPPNMFISNSKSSEMFDLETTDFDIYEAMNLNIVKCLFLKDIDHYKENSFFIEHETQKVFNYLCYKMRMQYKDKLKVLAVKMKISSYCDTCFLTLTATVLPENIGKIKKDKDFVNKNDDIFNQIDFIQKNTDSKIFGTNRQSSTPKPTIEKLKYQNPKVYMLPNVAINHELSDVEYKGFFSDVFIREVTDIKKGSRSDIDEFIQNLIYNVELMSKLYARSVGANYIIDFSISNFKIIYSHNRTAAYCICFATGNLANIY